MGTGRRALRFVSASGLAAALVCSLAGSAGATTAIGRAAAGREARTELAHKGRSKPKSRTTTTRPKATGNASAIDFYRKVVAATVAADGVEQVYLAQDPLTQVKYSSKGGLSWYIMQPKKAGFAPALDILFIGADHGKVTFVADTVAYGGTGPAFPPFGMLLTSKGEVVLAGGAPARTTPANSKTPVAQCGGATKVAFVAGYDKVGVAFGYALYGHFDPIKRVGKNYEITSTYPWATNPARTATEVDTVPVGSYLPTEGVINVSAGGAFPAFTMRWSNHWFHTPLYPPKTNGTCAAYVKGVS